MPDKFPPKNSGFRLGTYRFPSDVSPCRHAIYNHGCPSCDERDPEQRRTAPDPDVCAICCDVECDGLGCIADLDVDDGKVRWEMTPGRARKVAALLRRYSRAFSEAARLDTAATEAER